LPFALIPSALHRDWSSLRLSPLSSASID
jgi:hypothetical protein